MTRNRRGGGGGWGWWMRARWWRGGARWCSREVREQHCTQGRERRTLGPARHHEKARGLPRAGPAEVVRGGPRPRLGALASAGEAVPRARPRARRSPRPCPAARTAGRPTHPCPGAWWTCRCPCPLPRSPCGSRRRCRRRRRSRATPPAPQLLVLVKVGGRTVSRWQGASGGWRGTGCREGEGV